METTMSQMEVLMWLSVIKKAKEGNPEAINHLQAENKIRQEQNRPSVEEELKTLAQLEERKEIYRLLKEGKKVKKTN